MSLASLYQIRIKIQLIPSVLANKTIFGGHGQLKAVPIHGRLLGVWVQGDIPAALTCFSSINEHRASFYAVIDELLSVSSVAAVITCLLLLLLLAATWIIHLMWPLTVAISAFSKRKSS